MPVIRHSVAPVTIEGRVRARLAGSARDATAVAWGEHDNALILHLGSVKLRIRSGWLLCNVDANKPGDAKSTLQLLYFLGRDGQGDDTAAASTINATGTGVQIADAWGVQLQRVMWDGVLDAFEGVLGQVGRQHAGRKLELVGFCGSENGLDVDVEVQN